ncbi:Acs Acyl-coenzyme A synthetase-AMP- acid ligase [Pyrenophora tritici-repentis]|nr:Acs Acyl-coenzyme A synthetase-AMP- acid ligase [Pyrenophora tritici-repentis]
MGGVIEFQGIVVQPRFQGRPADVEGFSRTETLSDFLTSACDNEELEFERVAFHDPFLIVYSSGTTGMPKCIVHSTGGVLINTCKEGLLHKEMTPESVVLQYTTVVHSRPQIDRLTDKQQTGWIMYLVTVQVCLFGVRSVLYDGSPFKPSPQGFLAMLQQQRVTDFGTSPRFLHELQNAASTPGFEWFYDVGFPAHVHLRNISGGTDLAGRFGIGNPLTPVYAGGCQGPCLGMKVEVYDSLIESGPGVAVPDGEPGELVATASFPNQPIFFGATRVASGIETHTTLAFPIVIEQHFPEVADSLCVGQRRPLDNDETVILFLKMNNGHRFREGLVERIKSKISQERSKRHVPQYIFQTWDIPTTVNLKRSSCRSNRSSRQKIKASGTLANPESLKYYEQFARVEEVVKRLARDKQRRRRSTL